MAAISVTATSVLQSSGARTDTYISAVAITAGQAVYQLAAGTVGPCSSALAAPTCTLLGIAVNTAPAAGLPVEVCSYDPTFTLGGTIASGVAVLSHLTAGALTATAADNTTGSVPAFVGIGIGSNKIKLNPVNGGGAVP